ncbi:HlyD family efflux transporter periplasmic adaptor subunit [Denitromonas iodatirespirans]|uniref:HlyD family efflux transporter periplasmic adaptor subunit n=1 Tax=Denitromonas iodatirespirans TaxID=2795389 RepID=A0A944DB05_DENI1|nr:HlyD family efflux transporter periplasmic adaptor subunit [Denitromonas iodatirespirans]MBT0963450.1 HlyD family efflux transporter periplasmic adaptor subunit [Denitromonas iodatirespirans]
MGTPAPGSGKLPDTLPPLREELTLHANAPTADGSPAWVLQDPVRNLFFRIDWLVFEILARWHVGAPGRILDALARETTLQASESDMRQVLDFLRTNELLALAGAPGNAWLLEQKNRRKQRWWQTLIHNYLFFRLPLFFPDRWLERALPWVEPFFRRGFFLLTALALFTGVIAVIRQWEPFVATLVDTFSWQGLAHYGLTLVVVKFLHELGHAFTAKRYGCRVPTMGVAFLVLFPMAYTDVNETWKLPDHRQRLLVGSAGIITELVVAAWATLAWALLPDGALRSAAFLLATTTWVNTVAINLSPFLRFDGYFILMDWLQMPNLHPRAFALARWHLRESLFGTGEPPPEHLPAGRRRGLILFAYLVWIYRLVVFLGIALLVYHMFAKVLGIVLFAVEIFWFLLRPILRELGTWRRRWHELRQGRRWRRSCGLLAGLLLLCLVPWRVQVGGVAMLRPAQSFPLVTPVAAQVLALPVAAGGTVDAGAPLMVLASPELASQQSAAAARVQALGWQVAGAGFDPEWRNRQLVMQQELAVAQAQREGLAREQARLAPLAPFAGRLLDLPPDLAPGQWVAPKQRLGVLVDPSAWLVETYLGEQEIERIATGAGGRFFPETPGKPVRALRVLRIDRDATRVLPEPMLAAPHGGEILTRERNGQLFPDRALYRVTLTVDDGEGLTHAERGHAVINAAPRTLFGEFLKNAAGVLIRESGF